MPCFFTLKKLSTAYQPPFNLFNRVFNNHLLKTPLKCWKIALFYEKAGVYHKILSLFEVVINIFQLKTLLKTIPTLCISNYRDPIAPLLYSCLKYIKNCGVSRETSRILGGPSLFLTMKQCLTIRSYCFTWNSTFSANLTVFQAFICVSRETYQLSEDSFRFTERFSPLYPLYSVLNAD